MSEACDLCHHLFRSAILHGSKMLLKRQAVSHQAVAKAPGSVMLLEESSPRQALTELPVGQKGSNPGNFSTSLTTVGVASLLDVGL